MNVTGVDFTIVPITDFERSKQFYGEVLGLEQSKQWGEMPAQEFETGNLTIAIMQPDAFGQEFSPNNFPIAFGDFREGFGNLLFAIGLARNITKLHC